MAIQSVLENTVNDLFEILSIARDEYDGLNLLRVDEKYDTAGGAIDANDPWRKKEVSTHKPGSLANLLGKMVYLYSGANLNTDTPSASYFYAYFYDAVGNLLWTVDNSGYLNYTFSQDAFGNELSVSPFSGTPWSSARTYCTNEHQTGKWNDPFTGLYFFSSRWYDSGVGRFVGRTRVPVSREHPYTFVENNPNAFVDPFGKEPVKGIGDPPNGWEFLGFNKNETKQSVHAVFRDPKNCIRQVYCDGMMKDGAEPIPGSIRKWLYKKFPEMGHWGYKKAGFVCIGEGAIATGPKMIPNPWGVAIIALGECLVGKPAWAPTPDTLGCDCCGVSPPVPPNPEPIVTPLPTPIEPTPEPAPTPSGGFCCG